MAEPEWYHFACWLKITPEQRDTLCSDVLPIMTALAQALGGEMNADHVYLGYDRPELTHNRLGVEARFSDNTTTIDQSEEGDA
jgi:hypothetical protein